MDNDNEEILAPPEEKTIVSDLTVTDELITLQDFCHQQEVEDGIYLMVWSLERKLRNMHLTVTDKVFLLSTHSV